MYNGPPHGSAAKALEEVGWSYLCPSLVVNRKVKAGIGRKQFRYFSETFCQRSWREQRVITLTQVLIVYIELKRQQINRDGIGECSRKELVFVLLSIGSACGGQLACVPGIQRGFSSNASFNLCPGQISKCL